MRAQVDVTADDASGTGIPGVKPEALKAAQPMASVLGVAQRQMGAGWAVQDPWAAVRAGVAPRKPHKAQVREATCCMLHTAFLPPSRLLLPHTMTGLITCLSSGKLGAVLVTSFAVEMNVGCNVHLKPQRETTAERRWHTEKEAV